MHVIEVIPLVRGTQAGSLSYYSSPSYQIGSIVSVPVRNRLISAVVVDVKPVSKAKTALKAATFSLRKLAPTVNPSQLPASIINTVETLTNIYPASAGSILFALLPPDIRTGERPYPLLPTELGKEDTTPAILTATRDDRFVAYKSYLRQAFAHRGSVLLVVPSSAAVAAAAADLGQGIEKRVITFSSIHTKKQLQQAYDNFSDLSSAKLIITTPNFAFLDRHDITNIIIEECASSHYRGRTRPYLDIREVLKVYAKVSGKALLLGDLMPSTADEIRRREDSYHTYDNPPVRLSFNSSFNIVKHIQQNTETEYSLFTEQLAELLDLTMTHKGRAFLLAARKGLAPLVSCFDCGYIFRCPDSGAPYSLWRRLKGEEEERWFICSTSGRRVRAADTCPECGSWRLREQGVGIQKVEDEARTRFPKTAIFRFDHETASTHKKATKIINDFYNTKNAMLIGTQMALPYLGKPVELTAITSYEALRAVPTWRAEEQTLALMLQLREKTLKDCFVQTRSDSDPLLNLAQKGLIGQFYDEEVSIRESLTYPPYAVFIVLTYTGKKEVVQELEMQIEQRLVGYQLQSYNTPIPKPEQVTRHTLVRVKRQDWPDTYLMNSLRALPAQIKIEVNPERII